MDGATTDLGVRTGETFDLPGGYRCEVKDGAAVIVVSHASGRKVFSRLVRPGHFDLTLNGPEPLPGEI